MNSLTKKIFISHSSADKELVEIFVDKLLVCGMGFSNDDIFCTSLEGLGIKTGKDWRNEIQKNLCKSQVVILFITPNYKESEMCLNEMGAAWAINVKVIPIVVEPLNFDSIGVLYNVKQSLKLTKNEDLDELKDTLAEFITSNSATSRWNTKKMEAISLIERYLSEKKFKTPLSRSEFNKLEKKLKELNEAFRDVVKEKDQYYNLYNQLKKSKDKDSVKKLEKSYGIFDEYDDFIEKANKVGSLINKCSLPVQSIIYYNFTRQNMTLSSENSRLYSQDLKEACASQIINEDEHLNMNHPTIKRIKESWVELKKEFETLNPQTLEHLEEEYPQVFVDIENLDFWKEIIGVRNILF